MKIILAKNIGLCFGVNNAFELVKLITRKKNVLILGALAHNSTIENQLEKWGVKNISNLNSIKKNDSIIITAHGISPKIKQSIINKGAEIIDTTCPRVAKIHNLVRLYDRSKYQIIIFGDKNHKEVLGIIGNCSHIPFIINNINEAKIACKKLNIHKPVLLLSQTTQNQITYHKISAIIEKFCQKQHIIFKTFFTICDSSSKRQAEIQILAQKNDAVIIIGGIESANTKRLYEVAKNINNNTFLINKLDSKTKNMLKTNLAKLQNIAIASGASTPMIEVNNLIDYLKSL